jgi:RimJ/RimL family protein N-acetyltransferase
MIKIFTPDGCELVTPFPLINAVLANLQDGKIFKDSKTDELFYIIHKSGFSYLINTDTQRLPDMFIQLLESNQTPQYFHVYAPPTELTSVCNKISELINIRVRKRIQLNYKVEKIHNSKLQIPGKYKIQRISSENFRDLQVFNLLIERKYWKSEDDFLKSGFGFFVSNESGLPVSVCYSACVVNNVAEIDIATLPEFQQRGLAKLAVSAFVEFCNANGVNANWDCFEENAGSLKTAESVGFSYVSSYNFLSIFKKGGNHEIN